MKKKLTTRIINAIKYILGKENVKAAYTITGNIKLEPKLQNKKSVWIHTGMTIELDEVEGTYMRQTFIDGVAKQEPFKGYLSEVMVYKAR